MEFVSIRVVGRQKTYLTLCEKNRFLSISPLETYLQLKNNNVIIFLTFVAIILGMLEIIIKKED